MNPVGHQSTNWMLRLVLMVAMAAFTSLGTTSPLCINRSNCYHHLQLRRCRHRLITFTREAPHLYNMQHAMYFPWRGSHLTIWLAGSKQALVISDTVSCSWYAFSAEITGAYVAASTKRACRLHSVVAERKVRGSNPAHGSHWRRVRRVRCVPASQAGAATASWLHVRRRVGFLGRRARPAP